jgi:hypothetical protein
MDEGSVTDRSALLATEPRIPPDRDKAAFTTNGADRLVTDPTPQVVPVREDRLRTLSQRPQDNDHSPSVVP